MGRNIRRCNCRCHPDADSDRSILQPTRDITTRLPLAIASCLPAKRIQN